MLLGPLTKLKRNITYLDAQEMDEIIDKKRNYAQKVSEHDVERKDVMLLSKRTMSNDHDQRSRCQQKTDPQHGLPKPQEEDGTKRTFFSFFIFFF